MGTPPVGLNEEHSRSEGDSPGLPAPAVRRDAEAREDGGAAGMVEAGVLEAGNEAETEAELKARSAAGDDSLALAATQTPCSNLDAKPAARPTLPGPGPGAVPVQAMASEAAEVAPRVAASYTPATDAATGNGPPPRQPGPRNEELIGQTLAGRYTVLEHLGSGGMSVVYLARHELLKKVVAIKVLREDLAANESSLARFHREAMAAASIGDPHIVDVTDYGFTERGDAFIVMERLEGRNLRALLNVEGALEVGRAVAIGRQILAALGVAHARGIIHRDLKAENVFICQRDGHDFVKLLDFGISKVLKPLGDLSESPGLTATGVVMGTPQYIAPEQAHGAQDVDHRADIYALGVILYEMLTGKLPFSGKTSLEVLMKHIQEAPQPLRQRRPDLDIPLEVEQAVLRALAKSPAERFASAGEMLAALPEAKALPGGFSSTSVSGVPVAQPRRWAVPAAAAFVLLMGAIALFLAMRGDEKTEERGGRDRVVKRGSKGIKLSFSAAGKRPDLERARGGDASAAQPAAEARGQGPAPAPAVVPSPPEAAAAVTLTIEAQPASAGIYHEGKPLGQGRAQLEVSPGQTPRVFEVRATGHASERVALVPDISRHVTLRLQRLRKATGPARAPAEAVKSDTHANPYLKKGGKR